MIRLSRILLLLSIATLLALQPVFAQDDMAPWPTEEWTTSTSEAQGIDSQTLVDMLQFLQDEESNFHSILLVRNGYLVLEVYRPPYDVDENHVQFSATKSIVSILTGIAIDEGLIAGVEQPLIELFPDLAFDEIDDDRATITGEDFVSMRGGLSWSGVNPQQILENPVDEPAGTVFEYNQTQPRLMSYAVESTSGMDTLEFGREMLFGPLGIAMEDNDWDIVGTGARDGGTGISLTSQEMAKIGYLFLNDGVWEGQQIVSADWVEASTTAHVAGIEGIGLQPSPIPIDGYGYFWWVNAEAGYYMAWGIGSQLIVVFPEKNIVLVTTSNPSRPNRSLNDAIEEYIVPLAVSDDALPENPDAVGELEALIEAFATEEE